LSISHPTYPLTVLLTSSTDWSSFSSYNTFFTSKEFDSFYTQISPLLHGPPRPQLFNTNIPLKELLQYRFLEILRFPTRGDLTSRQISWGKVITGLETYSHPGGSSITGISLNLEEETFFGIIGWQNVTVYEFLVVHMPFTEPSIVVQDIAQECGYSTGIGGACERCNTVGSASKNRSRTVRGLVETTTFQ
jgi:hypothetical protein